MGTGGPDNSATGPRNFGQLNIILMLSGYYAV
jgi:hypothetical protein